MRVLCIVEPFKAQVGEISDSQSDESIDSFPMNVEAELRLRFGKKVLKNVAAWALPPEAEYIGCRMSAESFPEHSMTLDEKNLRFRAGS